MEKTGGINSLRCVLIIIIGCIISFHPYTAMRAQTRRALLVGIDRYKPDREFKPTPCRKESLENLQGCINDVEAMKGILESRFHFKKENIQTLLNGRATRERIISSFKKYLIHEASPGDICVFYFSGHGSWVKNSKSNEDDSRDETLVPADWHQGSRDIRDKELKKLFNRVLDQKAHLTVIVDACHSGSISRGIHVKRQYRFASPELCTVSEPPDKAETPAQRGALILAASRSFQEASEIVDENENHHGLFTWALLKVLRSCSTNESVENIMLRVDALMQSEGRNQWARLHHPTTEAPPELKKKPLFGTKPGERFGIMAAVDKVDSNIIKLRAGFAAGLRKNCELKKIYHDKKSTEAMARVTEINGLNRCQAKIIAGDAGKIKPGDLFEIHKWVASQEARMRVWIPASSYSTGELTSIANKIGRLKESEAVDWIENPIENNPTHILYRHKSGWHLQTNKRKIVKLGKHPKTDEILKKILLSQWEGNGKPRLFFQLPLSSELNKAIRAEIADYKDSIKIVSSKKNAHYLLVGRITGRRIQYAWILPNTLHEKKKGVAMPAITAWISARNVEDGLQETAFQLGDKLLRLLKIRAWMQLPSPPNKGKFPYRLFLKNADTGELKNIGSLKEGETYGLVIRAGKKRLEAVEKKEKRYVYVFIIDSHGNGTLLFPSKTRMNSENYFPVQAQWPTEIMLGKENLFKIRAPFGMDTFILLTTVEEISNPGVFNFKGVRRDAARGPLRTPLERLLYGIGSPRQRSAERTHTNWSIQRIPLLSIDGEE